MPTTYTSLLGLALPATGELSGTWGTTVNTEITSLLDSAVAGTTTLNTDADVTLTTTTGAANQARQAIILWTANGTVTRNITAPAASKSYVVINATAGTQSIVVRGVGPTVGVTLVSGERAVVSWNGSDFVKIGSNFAAGGSNTQVQYNNSGALAGSANLTFNGTTLTANSATVSTGNLTFSSTAQRITGDFSNATVGDRVAFQTSTVNGNTAVQIIPNGTASQTQVGLFSDPALTNGNYGDLTQNNAEFRIRTLALGSGTAVPMTFYVNGSERVRVDTSGNVAVGTTNAGTAGLSLSQTFNLSWEQSATESVANLFRQTSSAALVMSVGYKRSATANGFASSFGSSLAKTAISMGTTAGAITFYTDTAATTAVGTDVTPTERMRIDSSGNVGINRTTPVNFGANWTGLEIAGKNASSGGVVRVATSDASVQGDFYVDSSGGTVRTATNHALIFGTNAAERMRIDSSGNVGIGTASPSFRFVSANSVTDGGWLYSSGTVSILGLGGYASATDGAFQIRFDRATGSTTLNGGSRDTPAARVTIDNTGNVGIGTASPYSQLDVWSSIVSPTLGEATGVGSIRITNGASALTSAGGLEFKNAGDTNGFGAKIQCLNSSGPQLVFANRFASGTWIERMRIDSSGNVGIGRAPNYTLDVYRSGATTPTIAAANDNIVTVMRASGSTEAVIGPITSHPLVLLSANTERMRIDSSGNVGIGTASPKGKLDSTAGDNAKGLIVSGATNLLRVYPYYNFGGNNRGTMLEATNVAESAYGDISISGNTIQFLQGVGTERMRIDSSGNIVAGASAALATTATDGFLYVPTCAGTPTGTPTAITGMAPIVVDTTGNKMYFYSGGQWRDAGP